MRKKRPIDHELISRIEDHILFCKANDLPTKNESAFGKAAVGDHRLVANLRKGRQVGRALFKKIEAFISDSSSDQGRA